MRSRDFSSLMWADALSFLERAERLHRQFFRVGEVQAQVWEPPVDIVETAERVDVFVALPGVAADSVVISTEPDAVTVSASRTLAGGGAAGGARIHRLEIPYGRFARRIALPRHALELVGQSMTDGCLRLTFARPIRKTEGGPS